MAIITTASWVNSDGLPIWFGLDEAILAKVTGYSDDKGERTISVMIPNAAAFNATDDYVLSERYALPRGAIITNVKTVPDSTAFASAGGGTISIGVIDTDYASNLDDDAIVALASVAELNAGGSGNNGLTKVSPGDGVLVQGAALTKIQYLTISVNTAVFEAGAGGFEITYTVPKIEGDTLVYTKPYGEFVIS